MHHRRDSMDHHGHGRHGHHKREHGGCYESFGRHGRVGRHHSPHMDRDRCMRRGNKHHGFGKFDDISYHFLDETELRNIIGENPNSKDQIRQIVREFFRRGHGTLRDSELSDSTNEKSDESATKEATTRREGEFDWRHFMGRRGRRGHHWGGWTYGPCNVEQGRNNEPEGETSTNRHCGWHYRPSSSQCCKDKGRSSQEETSDNQEKVEQEETDSCCKWRRHRRHRHERFEGPDMHHFKGRRRHGCYVIFVDSPSFTRIATEEANKEVSQPSAPAAEPMERSEVNQERVQEAENQEVQEVAENLRKSTLE